jgi:hypothetical protein
MDWQHVWLKDMKAIDDLNENRVPCLQRPVVLRLGLTGVVSMSGVRRFDGCSEKFHLHKCCTRILDVQNFLPEQLDDV